MTSFLRHAASHLAFTVAEVGQWVCIYRNEWRTTEEWIVLTSFPDSWHRNYQKCGCCGVATHTTNAPVRASNGCCVAACCCVGCGDGCHLGPEDHENRYRNIQNEQNFSRIWNRFSPPTTQSYMFLLCSLQKAHYIKIFDALFPRFFMSGGEFRFRTVSDSSSLHIFLSCVNRIWLWNLLLFVFRGRIEPMTFSSSVS